MRLIIIILASIVALNADIQYVKEVYPIRDRIAKDNPGIELNDAVCESICQRISPILIHATLFEYRKHTICVCTNQKPISNVFARPNMFPPRG